MISTLSLAETNDIGTGQELAKLIFASNESNHRGLTDMGQITAFGKDLFVSMDGNDDGGIAFEGLKERGFGFESIAEDEGQRHIYDTA